MCMLLLTYLTTCCSYLGIYLTNLCFQVLNLSEGHGRMISTACLLNALFRYVDPKYSIVACGHLGKTTHVQAEVSSVLFSDSLCWEFQSICPAGNFSLDRHFWLCTELWGCQTQCCTAFIIISVSSWSYWTVRHASIELEKLPVKVEVVFMSKVSWHA